MLRARVDVVQLASWFAKEHLRLLEVVIAVVVGWLADMEKSMDLAC